MQNEREGAMRLYLSMIREIAERDQFSSAARAKPERLEALAARMVAEIPNASAHDVRSWLTNFEADHPVNFRDNAYRSMDVSKMSATEMLDRANAVIAAQRAHDEKMKRGEQ